MVITIMSPVSTVDHNKSNRSIKNADYGFSYSQHIDDDGKIIREYHKNKIKQSKECTMAILADLGMSNEFIEKLPDDRIEMYAEAESITSVSLFTKTNTEGTTEIVDEATAMEAVATYGDSNIDQEEGGTEGGGLPMNYKIYTDTYMQITFMVTYKGNALYHFSVDAIWLTMPAERYYDSIGMCASYVTVQNYTRSGWYSYDRYDGINDVMNSYTHEFTADDNDGDGQPDNIQNCIEGNWFGSGARFALPVDTFFPATLLSPGVSFVYGNLKAHFEFEALITLPDSAVNFAATATYDHLTLGVVATPSLELSTSGAAVSVSFGIEESSNPRIVELPTAISYTP